MDEKERLAEFNAIKGLFGGLVESLDSGSITTFDVQRVKRRATALLQHVKLKRQQLRLQQYIEAADAFEQNGRDGFYDCIASWSRAALRSA